MILHLVKKEFLLVKKYALVMPLIAIAFPLIMNSDKGMNFSFIIFLWTALAIQISLTGTLSLAEAKYSKGAALLSAIPYSRSMNVKSKYIFDFMIFTCYCIIYKAVSFFLPDHMMKLDWFSVGIVFLFITLIRGVIIPLEIKLGYQKTKYISMLFVFIIPFILPSLVNKLGLDINTFSIDLTDRIPDIIVNITPFLLAFIIMAISLAASIRIYSRKEL